MKVERLRSSQSKMDVIVHVDELLGERSRQNIENALEQQEGISHARFNKVRQHLMVVGYDPKRTSSTTIINLVRLQKVNAQLVGGI